jgi:hypothetical protein
MELTLSVPYLMLIVADLIALLNYPRIVVSKGTLSCQQPYKIQVVVIAMKALSR